MSGPPPVPGGRSAEERERARRERAARRNGPPPAAPGARDGAHRMGGHQPPPPRRGRLRARIFLALLAVALLAVAWLLVALFQPFYGDGNGTVALTVPRAAGVGQIADVLERRGVISSAFFFQTRARLAGKSGDLKPGAYRLGHDMSYSAALDALTKGPAPNVVSLVIPEGKSRREIAPSVRILRGNYLAATRRSPVLDPARYGAPHARDLEGFLFPATYQLKRGAGVQALVRKQLETFKARFRSVDLGAARHKNLTPYDVLIIASLVERETAVPQEHGLVASVIYNRLHEGIPLGIDATTRFQYNDWTRPIRQSQLASPSPYNTRIHRGLPPGPIGSPGLASIEAAAHPPKTPYLFYVQDCNRPGRHVFVKTDAQFTAASERYNRAREKAGGNAPKHC